MAGWMSSNRSGTGSHPSVVFFQTMFYVSRETHRARTIFGSVSEYSFYIVAKIFCKPKLCAVFSTINVVATLSWRSVRRSNFQKQFNVSHNIIKISPANTKATYWWIPSTTTMKASFLLAWLSVDDLRRCFQVYKRCSEIDITGLKDPRLHESTKISALFNLGRLLADTDRAQVIWRIYRYLFIAYIAKNAHLIMMAKLQCSQEKPSWKRKLYTKWQNFHCIRIRSGYPDPDPELWSWILSPKVSS